MSKLLVHAGTMKTGTTTIQTVLTQERAALRERGIVYPLPKAIYGEGPFEIQNHRRLAMAIRDRVAGRKPAFVALRERIEKLRSRGKTVVLSAEAFYRIDRQSAEERWPIVDEDTEFERRGRYLQQVSGFFEGLDAEFLLYFRRPDSFIVSCYAEDMAMSNGALDFQTFIALRKARTNYRRQIDLMRTFFSVTARCFETEAKKGLVTGFFEDNGLGDAPEEPKVVRAAIPNAAVLWLLESKRSTEMDRQARHRRWLFALQTEAVEVFHPGQKSSFWASTAERDAFLMPRLEALPEFVFPEVPAEAAPQCEWSGDDHARANAAFADWEAENIDWITSREAMRRPPFMHPRSR